MERNRPALPHCWSGSTRTHLRPKNSSQCCMSKNTCSMTKSRSSKTASTQTTQATTQRYKVKNVDELQAVIEKHAAPSPLLAVTQQIIASLGITSLDEWEKALEDKDLAALFPHEPKTTPQMFMLAQSLIRKAKARVKAHLLTLNEYDLSQMDETALTVFAGVKKDGRDVTIVLRPAYDNTVIIYYQSERDVLDFEDHELWVDTGKDVRRITFGHILKTNSHPKVPDISHGHRARHTRSHRPARVRASRIQGRAAACRDHRATHQRIRQHQRRSHRPRRRRPRERVRSTASATISVPYRSPAKPSTSSRRRQW